MGGLNTRDAAAMLQHSNYNAGEHMYRQPKLKTSLLLGVSAGLCVRTCYGGADRMTP